MFSVASAATTLRFITVSAILASFHTAAFPQCEAGQVREVTVPCILGRMTFPPRTEQCILPQNDGWVLGRANLGTQSLGGTGGSITISPEAPISEERRQSMSRLLVAELQASVEAKTESRTAHLASLLQSLAIGALPLQQAASVSVRVTLHPWGSGFPPCAPGMTTSHCPHVTVPSVVVGLICLPSARQ
jgi:hypothetical protein